MPGFGRRAGAGIFFCRCAVSVSSARAVGHRWSGWAWEKGILIYLRCIGEFRMRSLMWVSNRISELFIHMSLPVAPKAFPGRRFSRFYAGTQKQSSA